jgi:hypothetical protein
MACEALPRQGTTSVAGCPFRAVGRCCHALHAGAERWLINEKGSSPRPATTGGRLALEVDLAADLLAETARSG